MSLYIVYSDGESLLVTADSRVSVGSSIDERYMVTDNYSKIRRFGDKIIIASDNIFLCKYFFSIVNDHDSIETIFKKVDTITDRLPIINADQFGAYIFTVENNKTVMYQYFYKCGNNNVIKDRQEMTGIKKILTLGFCNHEVLKYMEKLYYDDSVNMDQMIQKTYEHFADEKIGGYWEAYIVNPNKITYNEPIRIRDSKPIRRYNGEYIVLNYNAIIGETGSFEGIGIYNTINGMSKQTINIGKPDIYSSTNTYLLGDTVTYNGLSYKCTSLISTPEAWNINHWTLTSSGSIVVNSYTDLGVNKNRLILNADVGIKIQKYVNDSPVDQFYVDTDGNICFRGILTGSSGTFSDKLAIGSGNSIIKADPSTGFWIGNTNFNDAPFKANMTGQLDCTAIRIKGSSININPVQLEGNNARFDLNSGYLRLGQSDTDYKMKFENNILNFSDDVRIQFKGEKGDTGATGPQGADGAPGSYYAPYYLKSTYISSTEIQSPTITGNTGRFSGEIAVGSGNNLAGLNGTGTDGSSIRFWAGNADKIQAPFRVTQDGSFVADDATLSGEFTVRYDSGNRAIAIDANGGGGYNHPSIAFYRDANELYKGGIGEGSTGVMSLGLGDADCRTYCEINSASYSGDTIGINNGYGQIDLKGGTRISGGEKSYFAGKVGIKTTPGSKSLTISGDTETSGNLKAASYTVGSSVGVSGSFTDKNGKNVTVNNGIVTGIS